jgi:uncharacterized protein
MQQKYVDYWRDRQAQRHAESEVLARRAWADVATVSQRLRAEFGATQVIVFGSLVQSDCFDDESDIDLAVAGVSAGDFFRAMAMANEVAHQWVDLKPLESLDAHFLEKVLRMGRVIDAEK